MVNNDITIMGVYHLCLYCRCLVAPRVRATPLMTLRISYRLKQDVNRYDFCPFSLKSAFLFSLLDLVRTHVEGIPLSLINFVDWLGAK